METQINNYKEKRWLKLRESALRRDKYMDAYLKRYGKHKAAEVVHHIFPAEDFPEYQFCLWNLISVQRKTHNLFHDRNSNKLTKAGVELLVRTARRNQISIPTGYIKAQKPEKKNRYLYDPRP